jgi:hypothetical protein
MQQVEIDAEAGPARLNGRALEYTNLVSIAG